MDIIKDNDDLTTFGIVLGYTPEETRMAISEARSDPKTIAKQIAHDRGITLKAAYDVAQRKRANGTLQVSPIPEGWSKKEAILEVLHRANVNAGVTMSTLTAELKAGGVTMNNQDLTSALWALQKQDLIKFNEKHTSHGSQLTRIRLTPRGRDQAKVHRGDLQPAGVEYAGPKMKPGSSRRTRQVGTDMTSYTNHGSRAVGGPVEVVKPAAPTPTPEIIPATPYEAPAPLGDPLPQNMKAPLAEFGPIVVETPWRTVEDFSTFPLLVELREKRAHKIAAREKAAKVVEAASLMADIDASMADDLMRKAEEMEGPALSKLELEMLRFIDEVTG